MRNNQAAGATWWGGRGAATCLCDHPQEAGGSDRRLVISQLCPPTSHLPQAQTQPQRPSVSSSVRWE